MPNKFVLNLTADPIEFPPVVEASDLIESPPTTEEIYLSQLDWETAAPLAIASTVAQQLMEWSGNTLYPKINPDFTVIMGNLTGARSEPLLKGQMQRLKADMAGYLIDFTPNQKAELESLLRTLKTNWTWESL